MQSEDEDMLLNASNAIWISLGKVGHLIKWCACFSESMGLESETKRLLELSSSLQTIRNSSAMVLGGIEKTLENKLNEKREDSESEREREREKEGEEAELHKKFVDACIQFGDGLRNDLGLDSLTKTILINKLCELEKEVLGK